MTTRNDETATLRERPELRPPGAWSFPVPQTFTLATGLAVQAYHRPGQFVISAGLSLDVPLSAEARDREGVAELTGAALDQGTRSHPSIAFADAVECCGAVLEASVGSSSTQVQRSRPWSVRFGPRPWSRPLAMAVTPLGTSSLIVHVALSDGWSFTGTQVAVPSGSDMVNQPSSSSPCQPTGMPQPGNSV